jgi:hypothetical protein
MAKSARARAPAWKRPGSPIGRKGPRKANPKYLRNTREPWSSDEVKELRQLVRQNTPTRVIGLKLGRSVHSVQGKAQREGISLKPVNRSPHTRRAKPASRTRSATRSRTRRR